MTLARLSAARRVHPLVFCALLAVFYLGLVALLPANSESLYQYGWTHTEYHIIYMLVAFPMIAVWFAAFYGYGWLSSYARSLENTETGGIYRQLANGVGWLALSLPVPSIISLILDNIANSHPGFLSSSIIIANYVALLLPLIAFAIIGNAARQLTNAANTSISLAGARSVIFMFVALGVMFCYLVFSKFDLSAPTSTANPYYLPIWLMLVTLIIPYLYAWFIGLLAAYEISVLASKTRGVLFSQALRLFSLGLVSVIGSSIALQYITSASPRTGHLELNSRLIAIYVVRIAAGLGFLMIAAGARKLRKIEEV